MDRVKQRGAYKGQLTRLTNFIHDADKNANAHEVEARLQMLKELFTKFCTVQNEIECVLDGEQLEAQESERVSFEEDYFRAVGKYRQWLGEFETLSGPVVLRETDGGAKTRLPVPNLTPKLPPIDLPNFSGTLTDWQTYKDSFYSMVHSNAALSDVNKFFYLKSTLRGDPLKLIGSLSVTEANYAEAIKLLTGRYENKKCLIQAHLKALFEQADVKSRSVASLRGLVDNTARHVASLRALGENVDQWDTILLYLITSKLDSETRRAFELHFAQNSPTYEDVVEFLESRCLALERVESQRDRSMVSSCVGTKRMVAGAKDLVQECAFCRSSGHRIYRCPDFLRSTVERRYSFVRKNGLCVNCLGNGHRAVACTFRTCSRCSCRHSVLLHFEKKTSVCSEGHGSAVEASSAPSPGSSSDVSVGTIGMGAVNGFLSQVMLYTAAVCVKNREGKFVPCRTLIDSGSQACFATASFISRLGLDSERLATQIYGIGGHVEGVKTLVNLDLRPKVGSHRLSVKAFVLPAITCDLPQVSLSSDEARSFEGLSLADPNWYMTGKIELLLSNSIFSRIVRPGVFCDKRSHLQALNTEWGWIVGGEVTPRVHTALTVVSLGAAQRIDFDLRKFWEIEENVLGTPEVEDPGEVHFRETVSRTKGGRFRVELPFCTDSFDFTASRAHALIRFERLERRFESDRTYRNAYARFIEDGLSDGVFEVCDDDRAARSKCYLPHHGVVKSNSLHTKLRCVFDGSAVSPGACSLNSVIRTGPKQQTDLVKVLMRFRTRVIGFTADIARMFCQISISENHRDFLRFFWRKGSGEPLMVLRHTRLPFGLTCSPFIAIRCLRMLADEFRGSFPNACRVLRESMYVDDLVAGAESVCAAEQLIDELLMVCASASFELRGWASSDEKLVERLRCGVAARPLEIVSGETSVLGLHWDPRKDVFFTRVKRFECVGRTKRVILSQLAQLFDPLGWLAPVIVKSKIIVQRLWACGVDWDEQVPDELLAEWNRIVREMSALNGLSIKRYVGEASGAWLCGFSDASIKAYGASVYLTNGKDSCLIASKTRVAPIKTVTLARLELCGALTCARLLRFVADCMKIPDSCCFGFSDSKIVLAWLAKPPHFWKTFVANRVSEIQSTLPGVRWSYVKSAENPADLCSRGLYPAQIVDNHLWWKGPLWLSKFVGCIGCERSYDTPEEGCNVFVARVHVQIWSEIIARFSSFERLIRVTAWVLRFVHSSRTNSVSRVVGPLTVGELDKASNTLARYVQSRHFGGTIDRLKKSQNLEGSDSLISLTPWLDEDGILRVGGRLKNSFLPHDVKHPIILPRNDDFVDKLIREEHENSFHMGTNYMIGKLRERFWILDARRTVTRVLRRCVVCFRHQPVRASQLQGGLPLDRTTAIRPFAHVGVDLCGPFLARPWSGRGKTTRKVYVALFVCFALRAVHLELVTDLSTDTFIAALRRFIGRRGQPLTIYSDNGRNFLGTRNYIKEWEELSQSLNFKDRVVRSMTSEHVAWKFIPPRSPNFGGLWEGNIRIFKNCFRKVVGGSVLTIEEFSTLLVRIESCMNSRPLCRASESVDDLDILTPAHFLTGTKTGVLFEESNDLPVKLGARWRRLNDIMAHYWRRWTREYLTSLQCRYKNRNFMENVKKGDIGVLVKENFPMFAWPLCKVMDVVKGNDGLVRVLILKIGDTILKRSLDSFCPLPDFAKSKSAGRMFEDSSVARGSSTFL